MDAKKQAERKAKQKAETDQCKVTAQFRTSMTEGGWEYALIYSRPALSRPGVNSCSTKCPSCINNIIASRRKSSRPADI